METDTSKLLENKREMFDGMRAYHQSEISHTNHAITILLAIAGAGSAVIMAILFPQKAPNHITQIVWGLFFVVSVLAVAVALTAHYKIVADHKVYAKFGLEYVKTSILLGYYDKEVLITSSDNGKTQSRKEMLKTDKTIGQGKGYRKTLVIIWTFAFSLIVMTLLFACYHKNIIICLSNH